MTKNLIVKKNKSLKGKLIETVIRNYAEKFCFDELKKDIQDKIQCELDGHLNFGTKTDINVIEDVLDGNISFVDEQGEVRVINFNICSVKIEKM